MKKSLLFSAMALSLGLLSCNQEDMSEVETVTGTPVTVSVEVPGALSGSESRTLPAAPEGHQLRCIMVVDYNTAADVRMEQVAGETMVNEKFRFTFTPAEEEYTCLFWADYVDEGAAVSDGKYTDKYYNTADLTNVTYKVSGNTVFNNPACDAFFGKSLAGSPNAVLKRPFVKLSFKDKNHETVQAASPLSVTYTVPSGFSVKENTVSGSSNQEIKLTAATPADKDSDIWFYNYVFAPANVNKLHGDILMTVGEDDVMIKTASLVLTQNYDITASIDFASGDGNVDVDVDIDDEYNDPDAPKVGQFMQKDGTFSDTYDAEKSIAIVFAAGSKEGDAATNYGKSADTKILGYAMGLSSVKRAALSKDKEPFDLTSYGIASPWAADDYNGYVYTQQLEAATASLGTELMPAYNEWKTTNSVAEITNVNVSVSGWYIPSARQLLDVMGMTLGYAGGEGIDAVAQNEQFASLLADLMNEGKSSWFGTHTSKSNVMSSSVNTGGQIMAVQTIYEDGNESISEALGVNVNGRASTFAIRPVLTIFNK